MFYSVYVRNVLYVRKAGTRFTLFLINRDFKVVGLWTGFRADLPEISVSDSPKPDLT